MFLSRFILNRRAPTAALASLLNPADPGAAADAHHKVVWTVFQDGDPSRKRDFLFRSDGRGGFMTLSARPPLGNDLITDLDIRDFRPRLTHGQNLRFAMRVNATVCQRNQNGRGRRLDVVKRELEQLDGAGDAWQRHAVTQSAISNWLSSKAPRGGFEAASCQVESHEIISIARGRQLPACFSATEITGQLVVRDPETFVASLASGFGHSKAWGCGLMLIRPAT